MGLQKKLEESGGHVGTPLMSDSQTAVAPGRKHGISCFATSGKNQPWDPPYYSLVLTTAPGCAVLPAW